MKRIASLFILPALIGCINHTSSPHSGSNSHESESLIPKLEFTEEIHNFGQLKAGETAVYDFSFINSGKEALEMKHIETGCTCLTVEMQKGVLKPGKKGVLKVIFDTSGLYGTQFQAFRVITTGASVDLAVTAEIINENIQFNN
jgi:hypothetical protein